MTDAIGNVHKYLGGHRGRLYKQGHVIKNWRPRFFVLERRKIKYYTDETLFRINGEFAINEETAIYDYPGEVEGRKFLFYVTVLDAVLFLSAQSQRDKMEWMEAITDAVHNGFKLVQQPELWLDPFYPSVDLGIVFEPGNSSGNGSSNNNNNYSIHVEYGNILKPSMVEFKPTVLLRLADPSFVYSLVLVDLDSIYCSAESKTAYLHWGVVNIEGSKMSTGIEVRYFRILTFEIEFNGLIVYIFLLGR